VICLERTLTDDPYYSAPGVSIAAAREWNVVTGALDAAE
jgi:hypothetical protein